MTPWTPTRHDIPGYNPAETIRVEHDDNATVQIGTLDTDGEGHFVTVDDRAIGDLFRALVAARREAFRPR